MTPSLSLKVSSSSVQDSVWEIVIVTLQASGGQSGLQDVHPDDMCAALRFGNKKMLANRTRV